MVRQVLLYIQADEVKNRKKQRKVETEVDNKSSQPLRQQLYNQGKTETNNDRKQQAKHQQLRWRQDKK